MDRPAAEALLATLASARGSVELGPVGVAASVTEAYHAYRSLEDEHAHLVQLRPKLEAWAREGPGARRIYMALLLRKIDEPAGRAVLETMLGSDEPCQFMPGGCAVFDYWLGEVASELLGAPYCDPRRMLRVYLEHLATYHYAPWGYFFDRPSLGPEPPKPSRYSSEYRELRALIPRVDPEAVGLSARLEGVVREGQPAARLYAALLLYEFDPPRGEQALVQLAADPTGVWEVGEELDRWCSVGQLAQQWLPPARAQTLPPAPDPSSPAPCTPLKRKVGWLRRSLGWLGDRLLQL